MEPDRRDAADRPRRAIDREARRRADFLPKEIEGAALDVVEERVLGGGEFVLPGGATIGGRENIVADRGDCIQQTKQKCDGPNMHRHRHQLGGGAPPANLNVKQKAGDAPLDIPRSILHRRGANYKEVLAFSDDA